MPDRPYTDADLRTEAARQHRLLIGRFTASLDPGAVLGRMLDAPVQSTATDNDALTWDEALNCDQLDEPTRPITALIEGAADTSEWAVHLGADGLEPDGHTFQLGAQGPGEDDPDEPFVRLHFAFNPTAPPADRDRFVMRLTRLVAENL